MGYNSFVRGDIYKNNYNRIFKLLYTDFIIYSEYIGGEYQK